MEYPYSAENLAQSAVNQLREINRGIDKLSDRELYVKLDETQIYAQLAVAQAVHRVADILQNSIYPAISEGT
jgi:hypothetical protein